MVGKIAGTLLGLLLAKIPGAVIGFILGVWFDWKYGQNLYGKGGFGSYFNPQKSLVVEATFLHALFSVMGYVAKSKGRVTEADISAAQEMMQELGLDNALVKESQASFREGKAADFQLKAMLKQFNADHHGRVDVRLLLLEFIVQFMYKAGGVSPSAGGALLEVAKHLQFNRSDVDKLLKMMSGRERFERASTAGGNRNTAVQVQLQAAYEALGVKPTMSAAEIKRHYRKLMREHHPDKLAGEGLPPQVIASATQRAQEIQAAYNFIKKHHTKD